jgi:predicted metal-binding membrane protein
MATARTESALAALLLALAGLAWWSSVDRMQGMDGGPWTALGTLGWFLGIWTVMMAAMMLPSAIPTVALYGSLVRDKIRLSALVFVAGYLAVWAATGLVAFGLAAAGGRVAGGVLAWDRAGRWAAGATLLVAAAYQLTPLKDACLARCRSPLAFLLGSWRPGLLGAFRLGVSSGSWCAGCCWALMTSLFALGVMSIAWTAFVAGIVALEKLLPWRRVATGATTLLLVALGSLLLAAPGVVPGLTLPGGGPMPMGLPAR